MSSSTITGAVIFAKDVRRVAKFYEVLFSIPIVQTERALIVLESARSHLVIHGIPKKIADTIKISAPPRRREDTALKLFFHVNSIAEIRAKAVTLGGAFNPKSREFEACDGCDPEGNVVQVRQTARGRAPLSPRPRRRYSGRPGWKVVR
jgi:predicted enzyme related to lactoylglutathione lyase